MTQGSGNSEKNSLKQVVNFEKVREKKLEEKRRKAERIFFKELLGIYSVTSNEQMQEVEILDVSEEGCSFQVPFNPDKKEITPNQKNVSIRLYFSQQTYLPLDLVIQNSSNHIEEGKSYVRYGCLIDPKCSTFKAFQQFVRFLKLYSTQARKDTGKLTFFYL